MKAEIFVVLCVALVVGGISVRADDTPDQAAARAALEQQMEELDHAPAQPPPDTNSVAAVAKPVESATNATGTVTTNAATAETAPATEVPATVAHAKAAPASTAPADADFAQKVPAANASAQAAALAALEQKMHELDRREALPPPDTNSVAAVAKPVESITNTTATAKPVTETPAAEVPVAMSPVIALSGVAALSAAPAVVAPAPRVSTAPAVAASVAADPVAVPTMTQPAAAPAMLKPTLAPPAATLPSSSSGQMRMANELVTTTGSIYKNVVVERVKEDGIVISYTPPNGGWAMTKIYFQDLPAAIRQQDEK